MNIRKEQDHARDLIRHSDDLTERSRKWEKESRTLSRNLAGLLEESKSLVEYTRQETRETEDQDSPIAGTTSEE